MRACCDVVGGYFLGSGVSFVLGQAASLCRAADASHPPFLRIDLIRTGCEVVSIDGNGDGDSVLVTAADGSVFAAKHVICTIPLGVLKACIVCGVCVCLRMAASLVCVSS